MSVSAGMARALDMMGNPLPALRLSHKLLRGLPRSSGHDSTGGIRQLEGVDNALLNERRGVGISLGKFAGYWLQHFRTCPIV